MKLWAIYVWVFREFSFVFLKRFLCLVGLRCSRGLLVLAVMEAPRPVEIYTHGIKEINSREPLAKVNPI